MQVLAQPSVGDPGGQLRLPGLETASGRSAEGVECNGAWIAPVGPKGTSSPIRRGFFGDASNPALALPSVSPEVPEFIALRRNEKLDLRIAEALIGLGWITSDHFAASKSIPEAIERGVVDGITGGYDLKNFDLELNISNTSLEYLPSQEAETGTDLRVTIWLDVAGSVTIGDTLMRMCSGNQAAAEVVLTMLERASDLSFPIFTPSMGLYIVVCDHWRGMDSYEEAVKEVEAEGMDPEDVDMPTEADIFDHMPRWTADLPSVDGSRFTAAQESDDPEILLGEWRGVISKDLMAACEVLLRRSWQIETPGWGDPETGDGLPEVEDSGPIYNAIVRWSDEDALPRLFDDWGQAAMNMGASGIVTQRIIPCSNPHQTTRMLENLQMIYSTAVAVDDVLTMLDGSTL